MIKNTFILLLALVLIVSCKSGSTKNNGEFGEDDSTAVKNSLPLANDAMQDLVKNISSPVEMASLIKSIGAPFSQKYLATTKNTDNYNTAFSKAFNLGIFSADMGYLNMYGKTSSVMQYITAIKGLADDINIGQFFDFSTLKRLASNNENLDSLMYIAVHSYNKMDNYLNSNKRSNLSALMVTGVYMESLFLITQVYKEIPNQKLADNIGEQKNIFSQLLLILSNYKSDPYFANLITKLDVLKKDLEPVKITIEKGEPESIEENGMLRIVQHERSVVAITPAIIKQIITDTEIVRNALIL
jgi:hypothetical protein